MALQTTFKMAARARRHDARFANPKFRRRYRPRFKPRFRGPKLKLR